MEAVVIGMDEELTIFTAAGLNRLAVVLERKRRYERKDYSCSSLDGILRYEFEK